MLEKRSAILLKNGCTELKNVELDTIYNKKKKSKIKTGMQTKRKNLYNFLVNETAVFESFSSGCDKNMLICAKKQRKNVPKTTWGNDLPF